MNDTTRNALSRLTLEQRVRVFEASQQRDPEPEALGAEISKWFSCGGTPLSDVLAEVRQLVENDLLIDTPHGRIALALVRRDEMTPAAEPQPEPEPELDAAAVRAHIRRAAERLSQESHDDLRWHGHATAETRGIVWEALEELSPESLLGFAADRATELLREDLENESHGGSIHDSPTSPNFRHSRRGGRF